MRFLVDSDVLSEPTKPSPIPAIGEWLARHREDLAVNPIVLGELEFGILALPSGRRRQRLIEWFAQAPTRLHVLKIDDNTAKVWARLLADLNRKGRAMPVSDSLIAATALQHSLTIATRNTRDFAHAGVKMVNPFLL